MPIVEDGIEIEKNRSIEVNTISQAEMGPNAYMRYVKNLQVK